VATVTALQSFVGRLEKDVYGPDRIEKHSQFPNSPSVFRGPLIKEGRKIEVQKGQLYDSNHPAVKAFPSMFGPVETIHPTELAAGPALKK
jgi:hypothetical protein